MARFSLSHRSHRPLAAWLGLVLLLSHLMPALLALAPVARGPVFDSTICTVLPEGAPAGDPVETGAFCAFCLLTPHLLAPLPTEAPCFSPRLEPCSLLAPVTGSNFHRRLIAGPFRPRDPPLSA